TDIYDEFQKQINALRPSPPLRSSLSSSPEDSIILPRRERSLSAREHSFSVQRRPRSSSRKRSSPLLRERSLSAQRRPRSSSQKRSPSLLRERSLSAQRQSRSSARKRWSSPPLEGPVKAIAATVNKGIIQVVTGDITAERVDVIIGSSSSEILKKAIIKVAGDEVQTSYNTENKNNPNAILISTPPVAAIAFTGPSSGGDDQRFRAEDRDCRCAESERSRSNEGERFCDEDRGRRCAESERSRSNGDERFLDEDRGRRCTENECSRAESERSRRGSIIESSGEDESDDRSGGDGRKALICF
ncbi:unnamed protein product, partial [Rotaria sp. Silwood1]